MHPEFLAVGHVARDLTSSGFTLGGAVTYGAVTASKLGLRAAIVTSVGSDMDLHSALPGVQVHSIPATYTTTFHNIYQDGVRSQLVTSVAAPLASSDVPDGWRRTSLVMLGPLVNEVDYALAREFPNSIVAECIQGWVRGLEADGGVYLSHWDGSEVLPFIDVAVLSEDDVADQRLIDRWKDMVPVLAITMGKKGARLHFGGRWHHVDAYPANETDPTGAGDVFAAAYLIKYQATRDPLEAAAYASCAASFCVEGPGLAAIPTEAQVEQRRRSAAVADHSP